MYQAYYRSPYSAHNTYLYGGDSEGYKPFSKLKVYGEASVKAKPDIAIVSLGVSTEDRVLSVAQQENARKMESVMESLRRMGIPSRDIQTLSYTIEPVYDYVEGKQIFRGYRVVHLIKIIIRDLDKVGAIIDAAVSSGANIVNSISFTISDQSIFYKEALRLAIEDAQSKAQVIQNKLRVKLNPTPVKLVEQGGNQGIPYAPMMLKAAEAATPIESGEITITARVEADFVYS